MRRGLANFISGVMAILFVVGFIFCARGMVAGEAVRLEKRGLSYMLMSQESALVFIRTQSHFRNREVEQAYRRFFSPNQANENEWRFRVQSDMSFYPGPDGTILGFGYEHGMFEFTGRSFRPGMSRERTVIRIPMWFLLGALGVWPGLRFWRKSKVRTQRLQMGHCLKCGFDLQGIYHHCPKCGTRAPIPTGFAVHLWSN